MGLAWSREFSKKEEEEEKPKASAVMRAPSSGFLPHVDQNEGNLSHQQDFFC